MKKEVKFEEKTFYVATPGPTEESEAKTQQSIVFNDCIKKGVGIRRDLNKRLKESGYWSEEDQEETEKLSKQITDKLEV